MKNKKKQHQQQTKVTKKEDRKTEILSTIKKLNGATMALNHIVQIYPEEVKAHQKVKSLSEEKKSTILHIQNIASLETETERELRKLSEERIKLSFFSFPKRFELSKKIERKIALLEHLQQMHSVHSSLVLIASDEIKKILDKHKYAGDPNLLLRKYYTFVTYFYNPEIEKLNSLMGTTFPTKDPHKLSTTPLFAITEESQSQKLLSIQDEIEM